MELFAEVRYLLEVTLWVFLRKMCLLLQKTGSFALKYALKTFYNSNRKLLVTHNIPLKNFHRQMRNVPFIRSLRILTVAQHQSTSFEMKQHIQRILYLPLDSCRWIVDEGGRTFSRIKICIRSWWDTGSLIAWYVYVANVIYTEFNGERHKRQRNSKMSWTKRRERTCRIIYTNSKEESTHIQLILSSTSTQRWVKPEARTHSMMILCCG